MNKRDVMKADGSSHCLFDLPCPSKVREPLPPPPSHENRAPLLMRCDVGWIYVKKLSSNRQEPSVLWSGMWAAESHINCPLADSSRPLPSRYPPSRWADTHTDDDLTWLFATHVISLGGVVGVGADSCGWWRSADGQQLRALMGNAWCEEAGGS